MITSEILFSYAAASKALQDAKLDKIPIDEKESTVSLYFGQFLTALFCQGLYCDCSIRHCLLTDLLVCFFTTWSVGCMIL